MKNPVHTILCWLLAISLVWLPLTVSADDAASSMVKHNCHDMSSDMQHSMDMNKVMAEHKTCDACAEDCTCNEVSQCTHRVSQVLPFIISDQFFSHLALLTAIAAEQIIQYQSQITSPDYRPPLV